MAPLTQVRLSFASCKQLGTYDVCVALPRSHPLAKKKKLAITDLYNEKLLCVSSGDCLNIDDFRKDMQIFYPQIVLEDVGYFYDLDTFNRCEEEGCLLLTLDVWDNIHPSLIPSFCGPGHYGMHVHEKVLARGVKVTGATVHFVSSEVDGGPIILQEACNIDDLDKAEDIQARVLEIEHRILPKAVALFCDGKIIVENERAKVI